MIGIVFAHCLTTKDGLQRTGGFGFQNRLPWPRSDADMKNFRTVTKDSICVMGANTFRSLETPLKGRDNVVYCSRATSCIPNPEIGDVKTKDGSLPDRIYSSDKFSISEMIEVLKGQKRDIMIIGGPRLIEDAVKAGIVDCAYVTKFSGYYETDTLIDLNILENYTLTLGHSDPDNKLKFEFYLKSKGEALKQINRAWYAVKK